MKTHMSSPRLHSARPKSCQPPQLWVATLQEEQPRLISTISSSQGHLKEAECRPNTRRWLLPHTIKTRYPYGDPCRYTACVIQYVATSAARGPDPSLLLHRSIFRAGSLVGNSGCHVIALAMSRCRQVSESFRSFNSCESRLVHNRTPPGRCGSLIIWALSSSREPGGMPSSKN